MTMRSFFAALTFYLLTFPAQANVVFDWEWTATTGGGTVGSRGISAENGDILEAEIRMTVTEPEDVSLYSISVLFDELLDNELDLTSFTASPPATETSVPQVVGTHSWDQEYTFRGPLSNETMLVPVTTNGVLYVAIGSDDTAAPANVSAVSWNGTPMTQTGISTRLRTRMTGWYLVNPDPGSHTLTFTTEGNGSGHWSGHAAVLNNVNQTMPVDTPFQEVSTTVGTTVVDTITSVTQNSLAIDALGHRTAKNAPNPIPTFVPNSGQTQLGVQRETGDLEYAAVMSAEPSTGAAPEVVTMGWTNLLADTKVYLLNLFRPVTTPGATWEETIPASQESTASVRGEIEGIKADSLGTVPFSGGSHVIATLEFEVVDLQSVGSQIRIGLFGPTDEVLDGNTVDLSGSVAFGKPIVVPEPSKEILLLAGIMGLGTLHQLRQGSASKRSTLQARE